MHVEKKHMPSTLDILSQASKLSVEGLEGGSFPPSASRRRKYLLDKLPDRFSPLPAARRPAVRRRSRSKDREGKRKGAALGGRASPPGMPGMAPQGSSGTMLGSVMEDIRLAQSRGEDAVGLLPIGEEDGAGSDGERAGASSAGRGSPRRNEAAIFLEGLLSGNRQGAPPAECAEKAKASPAEGAEKEKKGRDLVPLHGSLQLLEDARHGAFTPGDGAVVAVLDATAGGVATSPPRTAGTSRPRKRRGGARKSHASSALQAAPQGLFNTTNGLPRGGGAGEGQAPPFLVALEKQINSELAAIRSQPPTDNAPQRKGKYSGAKYMDDRLAVFRECARQLVAHFHKLGYGTVLSRVFNEYEGYARAARQQREEAVRALTDVSVQRDDALQQVGELAANEMELDKRITEEAKRMYDMVRGGRTYFELAAELEEVKQQKDRVQEANSLLSAKVAKTKKLKEDFEQTIKAIEQTFEVMMREKDITLSETERKMRALTSTHDQRQIELKRVISSLRDQQDEADSEQDLIRAEVVILKEHNRQQQQQYESLHDEHTQTAEEHAKALQKLQQHRIALDDEEDEGGLAELAKRAADAVPELGDPAQYDNYEDLLLQILDILEANGAD